MGTSARHLELSRDEDCWDYFAAGHHLSCCTLLRLLGLRRLLLRKLEPPRLLLRKLELPRLLLRKLKLPRLLLRKLELPRLLLRKLELPRLLLRQSPDHDWRLLRLEKWNYETEFSGGLPSRDQHLLPSPLPTRGDRWTQPDWTTDV